MTSPDPSETAPRSPFSRMRGAIVALVLALSLAGLDLLLPLLLTPAGPESPEAMSARVEAGIEGVRARFLAVEKAALEEAEEMAERVLRDLPQPTDSPADRATLFEILARGTERNLPSVTGFSVVDADGEAIAWRGRTFAHRRTTPPGAAPETRVVRTNIYKVILAEVPLTGPGGASGGAVRAYAPFNASYPLHNRYLRRMDFEAEAADALGLDSVNLVFEPSPEDDAEPLPVGGGKGDLEGRLGRRHAVIEVVVRPLDALRAVAEGWRSRALRAAAALGFLAALLLAAGDGSLRTRVPGARRLLTAGGVLAVRAVWSALRMPADAGSGPVFDAASFSVTWGAGWFSTPAEVAVSTAALAAATLLLAPPRDSEGDPSPEARPGFASALPGALAGLALTYFSFSLAKAVAFQSPGDVFPSDRVFPPTAASVLLLAVGASFAAGFLALLRSAERMLHRSLAPRGAAVRAIALVAVAATLASFQVQWENLRALREDALATLERGEPGGERDEKAAMGLLLSDLARADGLAARSLSRRGPRAAEAAFFLWAETPDLNGRPDGCVLEILGADGTLRSRFSIDMPPVAWLPVPPAPPQPGAGAAVEILGGTKGAERRRFLVGTVALPDATGGALGALRLCVPVRGGAGNAWSEDRPEILRNYGDAAPVGTARAVHRSTFDGSRLRESTHPDFPRETTVPAEVLERVAEGGEPLVWVREEIAGTWYHNAYVPRRDGDRLTGFASVGFPSLTARPFFLNLSRGLFLHLAILAIAASALALVRWAGTGFPRPRISFRARILAGFVLVGGLPVAGIAMLERSLAAERTEEGMRREMRSSLRLVEASLRDAGVLDDLATAAAAQETRVGDETPAGDAVAQVHDERVKEIAYRAGVPVSLFLGDTLLASSDRGIFATELFSPRISGEAFHHVVLLGRDTFAAHERFGSFPFLVGYAPVRTEAGAVVGVLSVPLLYRQDQADRDLARTTTLALALYLVVLIAVAGAAAVVARRMARPVEALAEGTRRVADGDLSFRIAHAGPRDELGDLVESFNRMTEGLEAGREAAARAEREAAWREMAKQVAHEIKNPLTPMRLHAQHLERAYRDGAEEFPRILANAVAAILRQTEALRHIATDFSAFARLPRRTPEPLDPATLLRETAELYRAGGSVEVAVDVVDGLPPVMADPEEMRLILINLCGNAVEAMESRGGGRLTLSANLVSDARGDAVRMVVEDTGPGIPAEDLPRLFDPSFSTKTGGTGLGLAIVRRTVEDLGGEVTVESEMGYGSRFIVRLPVG